MDGFKTSAMRQEEDMRREQGLSSGGQFSPGAALGIYNLASQLPSASSMFAPASVGASMAPAAPVGISATSVPAAPGVGAMGGLAGPLALAGIAAYTGSKGIDGWKSGEGKSLADGFKAGLDAAGPLKYVPLLGQVPAFAGALGSLFGSGKSEEQQSRDSLRSFLEGQGFLQRNEQGAHVNPTGGFNWGLDGQNFLTNDAGEQRRRFEVDFNDPRAAQTTAALDPLGRIMAMQSGLDPKLHNQSVGYLVNDALASGQDPQAAALGMYQRYGLSPDQVVQGLQEMSQMGRLTPDQFTAMSNTVNSMSSPGQSIGGGSYSIPNQTPQIDTSMLRAPQDPMSQAREQMTMRQQMPVYNQQTSQPQMPSLFPSQNRKTYQPLLALGGA